MSYKESLYEKIFDFYDEHGIENTMDLCNELLGSNKYRDTENFYAYTQGELCEIVLELLVKEYIEDNNLENIWIPVKSLVVRDIDYYGENSKDGDYFTEIDFVIFTPYKILAFECKNYSGEKIITDRCTVNIEGRKPKDVFRQHFGHAKALEETFRPMKSGGEDIADIKLAYFNFSKGSITDEREKRDRKIMPIIGTDNLYKFLDSFKDKGNYWDIPTIERAIKLMTKNSKKLHDSHLQYLNNKYSK